MLNKLDLVKNTISSSKIKSLEEKIDLTLQASLKGIDITSWEEISNFKVPPVKIDVTGFTNVSVKQIIDMYSKEGWVVKCNQKFSKQKCGLVTFLTFS